MGIKLISKFQPQGNKVAKAVKFNNPSFVRAAFCRERIAAVSQTSRSNLDTLG